MVIFWWNEFSPKRPKTTSSCLKPRVLGPPLVNWACLCPYWGEYISSICFYYLTRQILFRPPHRMVCGLIFWCIFHCVRMNRMQRLANSIRLIQLMKYVKLSFQGYSTPLNWGLKFPRHLFDCMSDFCESEHVRVLLHEWKFVWGVIFWNMLILSQKYETISSSVSGFWLWSCWQRSVIS